MARTRKTGTPPAPVDRVAMATRNPDGTARQTDGYEIVGDPDLTAEQLKQLHISNADQAWQRERLAAEEADNAPDEEVQARIDQHNALADAAEAQAEAEAGGSPAETAPPAS